MYRPVLVTAPAATPVSLVEAKAQCRVDSSDSDDFITALIAAAVSHLDGWTGILGRCLITQTWRQDYDGFCREMRLPLFPGASITSVKYDDADDVEQTVGASNYDLLTDDLGAYVRFKDDYSFPTTHDEGPVVRITYVVGEATAPQAIKHAMLMMVGHWYENREAVVVGVNAAPLPMAVDALLAPFRRIRF